MNSARFAVHAHTEWSYDGRMRLPSLARLLASLGYRGVLMCEHDIGFDADRWGAYQEACAQASSARFLIVPGIEYSSADNRIHVPAWGALPFLGQGLDTTSMLEGVGALGGIAVLAHPSRQAAWELFRPEWSRHLLGVEVWNVKQDGYAPSPEGFELCRRHPALMPFADLDFHDVRHLFPLAMEIGITGPLNRENVQTALRKRHIRGVAYRTSVESFMRGRRRQRALALERGRKWAFRRVNRILEGHFPRIA